MDSHLKRFFLATAALITILGLWLWQTAEEYDHYNEQEFTVPERFRNEPKSLSPTADPDDIDTTKILEPEPQHGWIMPPEPVRRAAGKVKRKIKRSVKKAG